MRRRLRRLGPGLNWRLVAPVVSGTVLAVGLGMLACFAVALVNGDGAALAFGVPGAVAVATAALGLRTTNRLGAIPLRPRDGFFAVTCAWVMAALVGAIPFLIYPTFTGITDAFFESMSGFTTTGATLIDTIEDEPDAILLWRSSSRRSSTSPSIAGVPRSVNGLRTAKEVFAELGVEVPGAAADPGARLEGS